MGSLGNVQVLLVGKVAPLVRRLRRSLGIESRLCYDAEFSIYHV